MVSALLLFLANPGGLGFWWLAWVGLLPVFLQFLEATDLKQTLKIGLLFGMVYHLLILQWLLGLHSLQWMGFDWWVSLLLVVLIWLVSALYQGLLVALFFGLAFYIQKSLKHDPVTLKSNAGAVGLVIAVTWIAVFYGLNCMLVPNPVGMLAYSQASCGWMLEASHWITFLGLEGLIIFCNLMLALGIKNNNPRLMGQAVFSFLTPVLICWAMGPVEPTKFFEDNPIWVSQINRSIEDIRADNFTFEEEKQAYLKAVNEKLNTQESLPENLVLVLPEGVLPDVSYAALLNSPINLISGAFEHVKEKTYNTITFFDASNKQTTVFRKRILVPFGETTPIIGDELMAALVAMYGGKYTAGLTPETQSQQLPTLLGQKFVGYVCFDVVFPHLAYSDKQQAPNAIVTVSNLSWFHQHPQLAKQYLAFNQFRAAELRQPLVLASNTGPSAFIEPSGEIKCMLEQGVEGVLDSQNCK